MTQKLSPVHPPAVVPFNESYPIDFSLRNVDNQAVLYIDDVGETLHLEITNTSKTRIKVGGLRWAASATSNHFELRFRPGTLADDNKVTLAAESANSWKMSQAKDVNGFVSLYLMHVGDVTLEPGQFLAIALENLIPSASGGSRGTRVELLYRNLFGQDAKKPVEGVRAQHLAILNHQGRKQIPLHVGFADTNKVLNDGRTGNSLILRITNTMKFDPANPDRSTITLRGGGDAPSRLIFSFVAGDLDMDWALGEDDQIKGILVDTFESIGKILQSSQAANNQPGTGTDGAPTKGSTFIPQAVSFGVLRDIDWNIRARQQGESFELTVTPYESTPLLAGEYVQFSFSNIVTAHPSGYTNLYVYYENIPGYWDGEFTCPIEKTPMIFKDGNVGIGTTDPQTALVVNGSVHVGEKIQAQLFSGGALDVKDVKVDETIKAKSFSGEVLEVSGDVSVGGILQAQSISGNGSVPSGTIVMWYGQAAEIPAGWALCDGNLGTPDLRDRFFASASVQVQFIMNTRKLNTGG